MAMARNKYPEQTVEKILDVSQELFLEKGYEQTTIQDIVNHLEGLSKGAIYHHFKSKDEILAALEGRIYLNDNPFEKVSEETNLNGLQKLQKAISYNQEKQRQPKNNQISKEMIPLLQNPHILAGTIESNRKYLSPQFYKLLEEGRKDGSIKTEYTKEIAELLPLLEIWMMPSIYPCSEEEMERKFCFLRDMFHKMGAPILDGEGADDIKKTWNK